MSCSSHQIIKFDSVSKSFGPKDLFSNISLTVNHSDRIAIIGENGAGKTTLIKLAIGTETPDNGLIAVKKGLSIGFLPQELNFLNGSLTVKEYFQQAQGDLNKIENRLRELEMAMSQDASF